MPDNIHVSLVTIAVSSDQSHNIILIHKEDIKRIKIYARIKRSPDKYPGASHVPHTGPET